MRTSSNLFLLTVVCLIAAGCAWRSAQDAHTAARDSICANAASNPLHLISAPTVSQPDVDTGIEWLLTQPTADPRLAQINRHMYLSLRALDDELRREQQLAACQQSSSGQLTAQSLDSPVSNPAPAVSSSLAAGLAASSNGSVGSAAANSVARAPSSIAGTPASGTFGPSGSLLKARLAPGSGGGNGATAPSVTPGSDDDIVAHRLRRAAEQETDPTLRERLWKEYTEYKAGTSAK